jgi:hypothetical protein
VERVLDELCERTDLWIVGLVALPFDPGLLHKLLRAIEYRRGRLAGRRI